MKQIRLTFLLLAITVSTSLFAQKKIALVIAIGKYLDNTRWKNLSSLNDLVYIKEALKKNGFQESNISSLTNASATKKAMVKALDELYNKASDGDVVYFHFSGHGQQIQDDNKDEADGYDEALVAYDAKGLWDIVDYHGENHFRDDLLEEKLKRIRKKVGTKGSVVVVIDACHSGTITRSAGTIRGTDMPCQSGGYKPNVKIDDLKKNTEHGLFGSIGADMGPLVVFSACSPNQPNYEMKDADQKQVGSLSYAFAKAITELPLNSDYALLFSKIKAAIQSEFPTQIPMFEGNENMKVFGNNYTVVKPIIEVETFNNAEYGFNDSSFLIKLGIINSINNGTTLNIYQRGTSDLYAHGIVNEAGNFQSLCMSDKKLKKGIAYEITIAALTYGEVTASYFIKHSNAPSAHGKLTAQNINNFLKSFPFFSANENADYTIAIESKANASIINLVEKGDSIRYSVAIENKDSLSENNLQELLETMKHGMRIKYLRKMPDGGIFAKDVSVKIQLAAPQKDNTEIILHPLQAYSLTIENKTNEEGLYYTVIDLMPDNTAHVLLPADWEFPQELFLRKGQSVTKDFEVEQKTPSGKEIIKVIFSTKPLDFRSTFDKTKTRTASAKPMEKIMDDLFGKNGNATRAAKVKLDEIGIVSIGFTIQK